MSDIKKVGVSKVVLTCSGRLDRLVSLKWLQETRLKYLLLGQMIDMVVRP